MYSYNAEDSAEAAYSALQAAIIFYEGLRTRSRINTDILTELKDIKDTMKHAILDSRASQMLPETSINNLSASLRRLISSLHGSSARSAFIYPGQSHASNDVNEQLVQYLKIAQKWLEAIRSASDSVPNPPGEGASSSYRPGYSATHRNQGTDTEYYSADYYCRL